MIVKYNHTHCCNKDASNIASPTELNNCLKGIKFRGHLISQLKKKTFCGYFISRFGHSKTCNGYLISQFQ